MTSSQEHSRSDPGRDDKWHALAVRRTRSLERLATVAVTGLVVAIAAAVLYLFSDLVILLFAAILLACQLRAVGMLLSRWSRVPYGACLAFTVVAITAAVAGFAYWRGPAVVAEFGEVVSDVRSQFEGLWQRFGDASWLHQVQLRLDAYLKAKGGSLAGDAAGLVSSTIGNAGSILLILVAGVYLAAQPAVYVDGVVRLLPHRWRERGAELMVREARTLRSWFVGQLVDMAFIGVLTTLGLWLLGVPLFPTLGLIAALFNFVPYVGALAGSVPAIIIAFGTSPHLAIIVAVLFVVVQTLEGNVISPLISKRTVDLPPVLTLLSQTVLGTLFGPFGLILATPMTAAILTFSKVDAQLRQATKASLRLDATAARTPMSQAYEWKRRWPRPRSPTTTSARSASAQEPGRHGTDDALGRSCTWPIMRLTGHDPMRTGQGGRASGLRPPRATIAVAPRRPGWRWSPGR